MFDKKFNEFIDKVRPESQDLIQKCQRELQKEYMNASREKIQKLKSTLDNTFEDLPNYSPVLTKTLYTLVKALSYKNLFSKVRFSGYREEAIDKASKGGLNSTSNTHINDRFPDCWLSLS